MKSGARGACDEAGCHDFTEPAVVRKGAHLFEASAEVVVVICRRCGAYVTVGWSGDTDGEDA